MYKKYKEERRMEALFNQFFGNIENKTGVKMDEVMKLVKSLENANFKDENTIRNVIKKVSKLANKPVSKEKEEMIVNSILNNKVPKDLSNLSKMMDRR